MSVLAKLKRPPWRTLVPGLLVVAMVPIAYMLWSPGLDVRDGRHDHQRNGIWIGHGWLGGGDWFIRTGKTNETNRFRSPEALAELASLLRQQHITDVFPHLCPADASGVLPTMDHEQAERLLDAMQGFRVLPWIGGVSGLNVRLTHDLWRRTFCGAVREMLRTHPRFGGVHLNVEPLTSGNPDFLSLLEELREALPEGKELSVAAYPPPTRWHPYEDVHWNEDYYRAVARRCDQMTVMMYDTALRVPKLYQNLMAGWTGEVLAWSEGTDVLLGVPTYADVDSGYHHPDVENLENALLGIHRGLSRLDVPINYQGVAIYCLWETDPTEWALFEERFLK